MLHDQGTRGPSARPRWQSIERRGPSLISCPPVVTASALAWAAGQPVRPVTPLTAGQRIESDRRLEPLLAFLSALGHR